MKGIGYFQNLRISFEKLFGFFCEFFGNYLGGFFVRNFFGEIFRRNVFGGFLGGDFFG